VAWRQHRVALIGITATLAVAGLILMINGLMMRSSWHQLLAHCVAIGKPQCATYQQAATVPGFQDTLIYQYQGWIGALAAAFVVLPLLYGVFLGAPLLAREYESGTYRFAFTQGAGRTRWLVVKVAMLAGVSAVATLGFSQLVAWWYAPVMPVNGRLGAGTIYESYGIVFTARAVFAFALGVLAGALLRRTLPAIAVTLAGWVAVVVTSILTRPHWLTPITSTTSPAGHPWLLANWWVASDGHRLTSAEANSIIMGVPQGQDRPTWIAQHYTAWQSFHPANRFWTFQGIEAGGLVFLALACTVAAVWVVRRRAA